MKYLHEGLSAVARANPWLFAAALGLYFFSIVCYAERLRIAVGKLGLRLGMRDAFSAYLLTVFVNNITPSAKMAGEFARAGYVYSKAGGRFADLLTAVVFERISEAFPVTALALVALAVMAARHGVRSYDYLLAALPVVGVALAIKFWDRIMAELMKRFKSGELHDYEPNLLRKMISDRRLFLEAVALSSAVWLLDVLRLYVIGLAVGWRAPLLDFVVVSVAYMLVGSIAVTPGGVGIVEGGLTAALVAVGAPAEYAIAVTIIERLISYVIATVVGAVVATISGGWQAWKLLRSRWRQTGSTQKQEE